MIDIFAFLLSLAIAPAHAQCSGVFGPGNICGNPGTNPAPPTQMSSGSIGGGTSVTSFGWTCDSIDHSTQAQNAINSVSAAGGGTLFFPACPVARFTATSSGTNLTVSAVASGTILPGMIIAGNHITNNYRTPFTTIVSQTSGTTGGPGVYVTSQSTFTSSDNIVGMAAYRADSQLILPTITGTGTAVNVQSPIRFTGPGSGVNINSFDTGLNINPNSAMLDLRYQGSSMAAVGYTVNGGSGYTNGDKQQTLTLSGGAGPIATTSTLVGGSGGTPGTYTTILLTGGTGSGAQADIVVGGGGSVTSVNVTRNGYGYSAGDTLTAAPASIGNTTGFSINAATVTFQLACSVLPQWQVRVSGGVVQGGNQVGITPPGGTDGSISVTNAGNCTQVPGNPVTVTSSDSGTGATFMAYWNGAKLQGLGAGGLEIDHLAIIDGGTSNSTAMIYTTNPTTSIHDAQIYCSSNATQDAVVLGGMLASGSIGPPNQTINSPFLGYGANLSNIFTDHCSRTVFLRTFNNFIVVNNVSSNVFCSGETFIEIITSSGSGGYSNYLTNNSTEACPNLRWGIRMGNQVTANVLINNGVGDIPQDPSFLGDYRDIVGGNFIVTSLGAALFNAQFGQTFDTHLSYRTGEAGDQHVFDVVLGPSTAGKSKLGALIGVMNGLSINANYDPSGAIWPPGQLAVVNSSGTTFNIGVDSSKIFLNCITTVSTSPCGSPIYISNVTPPNGSVVVFNNPVTTEIPNAGTTGTSSNKLAKLTGAPSTAVVTTAGDTTGAVGIVVGGNGTTGSAQIAFTGVAACVFDGATTAGHYVQISASVAGDCTDAGATYPAANQVIGRVLTTNGGGGTYTVALSLAR